VGKYFGTDGIRGVANDGLNAELAFRVGEAAAQVLAGEGRKRPFFTIGKDTRVSGDMFEAAITAGLCAAGADVMSLGVVPTPAVAYVTKDCGADAGIVISASHNPYEHNGIKIFNGEGFKLSDVLETRIEELLDAPEGLKRKCSGDIGRVVDKGGECVSRYIDHVVSAADGPINRRMRVMIDCANGAASRTAKQIFSRLNLDFELIKDNPNGVNINAGCGSTHIETLSKMVVAGGFDMGLAFDGDADRCLVVDERGELVDGDKMIAICGRDMLSKGKLKNKAVVATVMSNLGFHEYCRKSGVEVLCTDVGDRNVLEAMLEKGIVLGGEQSGHIIFLDNETTGDGQLAAVRFLKLAADSGKKVSELASEIPSYPQLLINVPIAGGNDAKKAIMVDKELNDLVENWKERIRNTGRILVRPSGTEALIRVMVEDMEEKTAKMCAGEIAEFIRGK